MAQHIPRRVVIVGAGHGGGTVAGLLRQQGYAGEILLLGQEPVGPYHRPPLSKRLLSGELDQPLQPDAFYREQGIELRTGTCVTAIDPVRRRVRFSEGDPERFEVLVLATGAVARRLSLPGMELDGVHELRTLTHARALAMVLRPGGRLAIVGGGWIGLEVAASARAAGVEVTVLEREERLLARVASAPLSAHLAAHHETHGTRLIVSADVIGFVAGANGGVAAVKLANGRSIVCDHVLVGVGAVADDALARAAGLTCDGGIVVDEVARTSQPRIYAVGDATRRPLAGCDELVRLESIPSTLEQARQVVAHILQAPSPAAEVPWFWSDQFDLKVQVAGLLPRDGEAALRGEPGSDRLSIFHTRGRRLVAVEAVNAAADFMAGKHLIDVEVDIDVAQLGDPGVSLRDIAPRRPVVAAAPPSAPRPSPSGVAPPRPPQQGGTSRIIYVQHDGTEHAVDVQPGLTLMEGAVRHNLAGIVAECGGTCACGTCQVYVPDAWRDRLPPAYPEEDELLEYLTGRQEGSRLSCQIVVTAELDGLVVRLPEGV